MRSVVFWVAMIVICSICAGLAVMHVGWWLVVICWLASFVSGCMAGLSLMEVRR